MDKIKYISLIDHKKNYKKTDIQPFDIIFSRIGTVGKSYMVTKSFYEFSILHSLCQIRVNALILPKFLLYFLRGSLIQKRMWITVQSIGVPDFGLTEIGNLPVFLPPLPEQKQIISILSNIEEQIIQQYSHLSKLYALQNSILNSKLTKEETIVAN